MAENWLRTRPAKSASFNYDEISRALPVPVHADVLRRVLPLAAQGTGWKVAAYEHSVTLTYHLPPPVTGGGLFDGGDY